MRNLRIPVVFLAGGLLLAACGQKSYSPVQQQPRPVDATESKASSQSPVKSGPTIPKDARWTIYCDTIAAADHAIRAKALQATLMQQTELRDWYIVQGDGRSTLYYGFYREIDQRADAREATRAQRDRQAVASLVDRSRGVKYFRTPVLVPLESPDPMAPPEWDLRNAKGYWTIEVAVYREDPKRKEYAVDVVRELRTQGHEAYFYHGATTSSVCIGAWPMNAIKPQETDVARTQNPNDVVMVLPNGLSVPADSTTADGRRLVVYQEKMEVQDAGLAAMWKQFPEVAVNGAVGKKVRVVRQGNTVRTVPFNSSQGEVVEIINHSRIVPIPSSEPKSAPPPIFSGQGSAQAGESVITDPFGQLRPPPPPGSTGAKLRSLED